jgi:hypothetical protein
MMKFMHINRNPSEKERMARVEIDSASVFCFCIKVVLKENAENIPTKSISTAANATTPKSTGLNNLARTIPYKNEKKYETTLDIE